MPRCSPLPKGSNAGTRPTFHNVDQISSALSQLNVTRNDASEPSLWFIPHNLQLPPRMQLGPSHSKRQPAYHVPRPRNPFILFRSHLLSQRVLPAQIPFCRDHRQVSRIVSYVWRVLPGHEKKRFYQLGDEERRVHQLRFPTYTGPSIAASSVKAVRHDSDVISAPFGSDDFKCEQIAQLLVQNVRGKELVEGILEVVGTVPEGQVVPTPTPRLTRSIKPDDMELDSRLGSKAAKQATNARTKNARSSKMKANIAEELVSHSECSVSVESMSTPSTTPEGATLDTLDASFELDDSSNDIEVVKRLDHYPEWSLDVATQPAAFDQDDSFEPFEDFYGPIFDESFASQYIESVHHYQVQHAQSSGTEFTTTGLDAYLNESLGKIY